MKLALEFKVNGADGVVRDMARAIEREREGKS
jgi:hypothetical protein